MARAGTRFPAKRPGNPGIGTTGPNEKLEVAGAIKVSEGGYSSTIDGATTPVPSGGQGRLCFLIHISMDGMVLPGSRQQLD